MKPQQSLNAQQLIRYSRHLRLPGFDAEAQRRLLDAKILVVGLGGLGSPASLYLAAAGIGTIGLAEFDKIELHNLQRQILFDSDSVGATKLDAACRRLAALNPDCRLIRHPDGVTPANAMEIFANYDIILDGTDNFPTRYLCNDAAWLSGKTLVHGSIFQFEGQLAVFDQNKATPCYRCLFPSMPEPGTVPNCDQAGVLGALPGVVGSLQALEAIKIITRPGDAQYGKLFAIDTLTLRTRKLSPRRDPDCPLCGHRPSITAIRDEQYQTQICATMTPSEKQEDILSEEISVGRAQQLLTQHPEAQLLDVREMFEREIVSLPESAHIPLAELPLRWQSLDTDRPVVVYCHHGMRSLRAVHFLRQRGFVNSTSMRGGIDAWAREIDPSLPRY